MLLNGYTTPGVSTHEPHYRSGIGSKPGRRAARARAPVVVPRFDLPSGDHRVVLDLVPTRTRRAGRGVSIAPALAATALMAFSDPTGSKSMR